MNLEPLESRDGPSLLVAFTPDPLFVPAFRRAVERAAADVSLSLPGLTAAVTVEARSLGLDRLAETDAAKPWVVTFNRNTPQSNPYSVATHEFGHTLGVGQAPEWFGQVRNGHFVGASAVAVYGAPVPLTDNGTHVARGVRVGGRAAAMGADVADTGANWSELDAALLRDIGITSVYVDPTRRQLPPPAQPFPGFAGGVANVTADFTGDGVLDYGFVAQAGGRSHAKVFDGTTGRELASFFAYSGYDGPVGVGAGDADGDGRPDLLTAASNRHVKAFAASGATIYSFVNQGG